VRVWKALLTSSLDVKRFPETNFFSFEERSESSKSGKEGDGRENGTSNHTVSTVSRCIVLMKDDFLLLQTRPLLVNFDIQLVKTVRVILD
jgi:hypothetical protein